uniref:Uncharacterized protein n=1 Tax=Solanum tuberosum TaxID=4113 RepID=M1DM13_SOLTU
MQAPEAGFIPPGRGCCSRVRTVVAGPTRGMLGFCSNLNSFFCSSSSSCSNVLRFLPNKEANNYKRVGFARAGGGGSIPSLPIRDPLPIGQEISPNGRVMIFITRPRETLP